MSTAVVVGSGPNGLAAAALLAKEGVRGHRARSRRRHRRRHPHQRARPLPGLLHDECSAFHPMAVGSTAFADASSSRTTGCAGAGRRSTSCTRSTAGTRGCCTARSTTDRRGARTRRRALAAGVRPPVGDLRRLGEDIMGPLLRVPRHPLRLARFGLPTLAARGGARQDCSPPSGRGRCSRGVAAHALRPLHRPAVAPPSGSACSPRATGTAGRSPRAAHVRSPTRWPTVLAELGGKDRDRRTGRPPVDRLPPSRRRRCSTWLRRRSPRSSAIDSRAGSAGAAAVPARPRRVQGRLRGRRTACPWTHEAARRAGTSTSAEAFDEIVATERAIARRPDARAALRPGRSAVPGRPAAVVGRRPPASTPTPTCPHGYAGDATEAIIAQIERFAPGFRERVVGTAVRSTVRDGRLQPELRRRRHRHRRQGRPPARLRAARHALAVHARRPGHVHLLGGNAAGAGRARDVRSSRRHGRVATSPPRHVTIQPVEAFDSTSSVNNSEGFFQL